MSIGSGAHEFQVPDDGIHLPFFATYADATDRAADTRISGPRVVAGDTGSAFRALAAEDLTKIALQVDDNSIWMLTATTPTWFQLFGGIANNVEISVQKHTAGTINKGQAVYLAGYDATDLVATVELAQANASSTMPAIGIAAGTITQTVSGTVRLIGRLGGLNTSAFSDTDQLWVDPAVAGGFVNARPTGAAEEIQIVAQVARAHATLGVVEVLGAGRVNALPNLTNTKIWQGNGSNLPVEVDLPSSGAGALKGLSQSFSTTTTDSDPGAGNFRLNAGQTFIYMDDDADNGVTITAPLLKLREGDHVYIEQIGDTTRYHLAEVTGDPEDATGYVKVPITILNSGAALQDTELCGFAFFYSANIRVNGSLALVRTANYTLASSPSQILYDTTLEQNSDYYSVASNTVTFDKAGRYLISAGFTVDITSGSTTCLATLQLYEDVGAGFVAIPEGISQSRCHNTNVPEQHVNVVLVREFAVGDDLRVYSWRAAGTATGTSLADHNRLNIVALEVA